MSPSEDKMNIPRSGSMSSVVSIGTIGTVGKQGNFNYPQDGNKLYYILSNCYIISFNESYLKLILF